jgi:hypothetical protein
MATVPTSPFTPSELVFFHGEAFANQVLMGNVELLHTDAKVSAAQLGQAMLMAAFLGMEQAGAIRPEVREKKALLGLRSVPVLYAELPDAPIAWPAPSLESEIARLVPITKSWKAQNRVSNLVYGVLGEDSSAPWQSLCDLIKGYLAQRDLLTKVTERKLKVFTVTHYELPDSTAALILRHPAEPVQALLQACETLRPQLWKLLVGEFKLAIAQRTEKSDSDD